MDEEEGVIHGYSRKIGVKKRCRMRRSHVIRMKKKRKDYHKFRKRIEREVRRFICKSKERNERSGTV